LLLIAKPNELHTAKKKYKGTGVPNAVVNIGNVIITIEAIAQFTSVV
jgi:hypothetical protein